MVLDIIFQPMIGRNQMNGQSIDEGLSVFANHHPGQGFESFCQGFGKAMKVIIQGVLMGNGFAGLCLHDRA